MLLLVLILTLVGRAEPPVPVMTPVEIIILDLDGRPQAGLIVSLQDAADRSLVLTTDAAGGVRADLAGDSLWIRAIAQPDGRPLQMDRNTPDGGMRLPLTGAALQIVLLRDGALVFRAPAVMDAPPLPGAESGVAARAATPDSGGAAIPPRFDDRARPPHRGGFWLLVAGVILMGVGLGTLLWTQVRIRRRASAPRRPPGGPV